MEGQLEKVRDEIPRKERSQPVAADPDDSEDSSDESDNANEREDEFNDDLCHCAGITSLAYDESAKVLFTASRDSTVRKWTLSDDSAESIAIYHVHADWVNDIAVVPNSSKLVTCSSDCSVCVVSTESSSEPHSVLTRLGPHRDYVKKVLYRHGDIISAGLDGNICINSVVGAPKEKLRMECRDSIYSLGADLTGHIIASGGSRQKCDVFDLREPSKLEPVVRLSGHADTIKCVVVSADGLKVISGASDASIKLWDLRMPSEEAHTFSLHSDSVWCLWARPDFSTCFSGGRDGIVNEIDLANLQSTRLFVDPTPVSALELIEVPGSPGLRVVAADASGSAKIWTQKALSDLSGQTDTAADRKVEYSSVYQLPRETSIVKACMLPNRFQFVSKSSSDEVKVWNILTGSPERDCTETFDQVIEQAEPVSAPGWCTIDCKTGAVTITLDEHSVAECYLHNDIAGAPIGPNIFNIGVQVLRCLLRTWISHRSSGSNVPSADPVHLPQSCWVAIIRDGVCVDVRRSDLWTGDEPIPRWAQDYLRMEPNPAPRTAAIQIKPASASMLAKIQQSHVLEFFRVPSRRITGAGYARLYNLSELIARNLKLASLPEELSNESYGWTKVFEFYCKQKKVEPKTSFATLKNVFWKLSSDPEIEIDVAPRWQSWLARQLQGSVQD